MKKKTAAMVLAALMAFSMTACEMAVPRRKMTVQQQIRKQQKQLKQQKIQLRKTPHQVMKQLSFTGLISVRVMWKLRYAAGSRSCP